MRYGKGKGELPPQLRRRFMCQRYGLVPRVGGLNDQDYVELVQADACENIYRAIQAYRRQKLTDEQVKLVNWLAKMKVL